MLTVALGLSLTDLSHLCLTDDIVKQGSTPDRVFPAGGRFSVNDGLPATGRLSAEHVSPSRNVFVQ